VEALAAGRQDLQAGRRGEPAGDLDRGRQNLLEVVQHQQQLAGDEGRPQHLG